MGEDRYWILEFSNDENKIDAACEATGLGLVGLVDEDHGGVIGYLAGDLAYDICEALNLAAR